MGQRNFEQDWQDACSPFELTEKEKQLRHMLRYWMHTLTEENARLTAELAEYSMSEQEADGGTSIYSLRQGLKQERAKVAELTAQVAGLRDGLAEVKGTIERMVSAYVGNPSEFRFTELSIKQVGKIIKLLASPDPGEKYRKVVEAAKLLNKESLESKTVFGCITIINDNAFKTLKQALAELEGRA